MRSLWHLPVGAALVAVTGLLASPLAAQGPETVQVSALDKEKRDLAREIIDLGLPAQSREEVMFASMDQMASQMRVAVSQQAVLDDPAIDAIVDKHVDAFLDDAKAILLSHLPKIVESWALAYATIFTVEELRDIREFVSTPSGQKFFELSSAVTGEPNFAAANQAFMNEAMASLPRMQEELRADLIEYLSSLEPQDAPNES